MKRRRLILAGTAVALLSACSGDLGMPDGATRQSQLTLELWRVTVYIGAAIGLLVYGLLGWILLRYRRRRDDDSLPVQTREHRAIELTYTLVPVVIVVVLFALMTPRNREIIDVAAESDLVVQVEAFDWSWRFTYLAAGDDTGEEAVVTGTPTDPPVIELPVGATVRFEITSGDVAHSFYVPNFLYKLDAIPGRVNTFEVELTSTGTFAGQCAEFCGLDHARMRFTVEVVEPGDFETWLRALSAPSGGSS